MALLDRIDLRAMNGSFRMDGKPLWPLRQAVERFEIPMSGGLGLPVVRMHKEMPGSGV